MKYAMVVLALLLVATTIALAQPTSIPVPTSPQEIAGQGQQALVAAQKGQWWLLSALIVSALMAVFKAVMVKAGKWDALGRWRYVIVPVASIVASLLAAFQGGVNWQNALAVFTATNTMATLQVVWDRVVRGNT
jgi:hypothetical protein